MSNSYETSSSQLPLEELQGVIERLTFQSDKTGDSVARLKVPKAHDLITIVGDRVIQKVNDYNWDVFNGDLGVIETIDLEEVAVTVQFSTKTVTYDLTDLNEITLVWAVTIHKSRGSKSQWSFCPCICSTT